MKYRTHVHQATSAPVTAGAIPEMKSDDNGGFQA